MFANNKYLKKPLVLWSIVAATLIIGILLIVWVNNARDSYLPLVLIVIDFITLSIAIQSATMVTFKFKAKPRKHSDVVYPLNDFLLLEKNLLDNGYFRRPLTFGAMYNKKVGSILFKVLLVQDCDKYFNNDKTEDVSSKNENFKNITGLIGFEIFLDPSLDVRTKLIDFAFQSDKVFYQGFFYDSTVLELTEVNYQKANPIFAESYQKILNDLKLQRKE